MTSTPPGLAAERTSLAWQRSGLSLAATGVVVAKGLPGTSVSDNPALGVITICVGLLVSLIATASGRRRARQAVRTTAVATDLTTISLTITAAGAILLVLAAWPR